MFAINTRCPVHCWLKCKLFDLFINCSFFLLALKGASQDSLYPCKYTCYKTTFCSRFLSFDISPAFADDVTIIEFSILNARDIYFRTIYFPLFVSWVVEKFGRFNKTNINPSSSLNSLRNE